MKGEGQPITCQCKHRGEVEVQLYPYATLAQEGGGWSLPCCGHFTTEGRAIVEEVRWAPGQFWMCLEKRKLLPPLGFE